MVRVFPIALLAALASSAAFAQTTDWGSAGGSLFFRPTAMAVSADTPAAEVQVVASDQPFDLAVQAAAARHGLDPKLLHALVAVESAYRPHARSAAGAVGLTQLMPGAAAETGVADRYDLDQNLAGGARYLATQIRTFGDLRLALAAFNAGPHRVTQFAGVPPYAETRTYVARVVDCYLALAAGRTVRSARDCPAADLAP